MLPEGVHRNHLEQCFLLLLVFIYLFVLKVLGEIRSRVLGISQLGFCRLNQDIFEQTERKEQKESWSVFKNLEMFGIYKAAGTSKILWT